ncbi:DUF4365 domain-containing protein [Corallococcus sp. BB11-1]|nr:DUF4365 domain-containing protein [Corallococcus sp. BB11-1]
MARLQGLLPEDRLIFRAEDADDFGVDGTLELVTAGGATNFRSHAQLKSTESLRQNADGSISLSVDVANINYLLNGSCPIYLLYVVPTNAMYLSWARTEKRRLDNENNNWTNQETATIRFSKQLDASAIDEICDRIRDEASLRRRVSDVLGRNSLSPGALVEVKNGKIAFTDIAKEAESISASGFALVTAGFATQIINQIDKLAGTANNNGKLALIRAYASYRLGNLLEAEAWISRSKLRLETIEAQDQNLLHLLSKALDFHLGRITSKEYFTFESELATTEGGETHLIYRINSLRWQILEETDSAKRSALVQQFLSLTNDASTTIRTDALKAQIELQRAEAEGWERIGSFVSKAMSIRAQAKMPPSLRDPRVKEGLAAEIELWRRWESQIAHQISSNAERFGPLITADSLYIRASIRAQMIHMQSLVSVIDRETFRPEDSMLAGIIQLAEAARDIYSKCEAWDGDSKSTLIIAEVESVRGNIDIAKKLASSVLPKAQALRYAQTEQRALALIKGETYLKTTKEQWEKIETADPDFAVSQWSDADVRKYAAGGIQLLGLSSERLVNAEKDYAAMRVNARARIDWCRHLAILQNLTHTRSRESFYAEDPPRICACTLLKHRSQIESQEPEMLVSAFKRAYCLTCAHRAPKGANSTKQ